MRYRQIAGVAAAAAVTVLLAPVGSPAAAAAEPQPRAAAACVAYTKVEAVAYSKFSDGTFRRAAGTENSVKKDTCFIELDENRYPPGWYTGWDGYWELAKESDKGAVYKQFGYGVVRKEANGYKEGYLVDLAQLRDVAENVNCDAKATKNLSRAWRAKIRVYGEPNRQLTDWIRTWNEVTGFTDEGGRWREGQCIKLTGSASKWDGHTFYETPVSGGGGGHLDWVRDDEVQLLRK
ncbi:hypothetical protein [Kitasatospora sp. NPDC093806]|uniref:hypothetical protein n=1 Tax=Kitasatospora sp. NPDC093806 TaxID=3155075 RepID=UPI00341DF257